LKIELNKMPILSICIPTYNRSKYLKETLNSIVSQNIFLNSDKIEIIISDNCSNDNTRSISMEYVNVFPNKVKYNRNELNIYDENFLKALSLGNGDFLKLNNDDLIHEKDSLDKMIKLIEDNSLYKPILLFTSGALKKNEVISSIGINNFIVDISYFSTWIGSFGIWKENYHNLVKTNIIYFTKNLRQTELIYKQFQFNNSYFIDDRNFFNTNTKSTRGGYDFVDVFLYQYNFILKQDFILQNIKKNTYLNEMNKVLLNHLAYNIAKYKTVKLNNTFDFTDSFKKINKFYLNNPFYLLFFYIKFVSIFCYMFLKNKL